ncbi:MAG: hypothetical protein DSZ31_04690 [Gammaproteobacteria bacterium]|nr:MAG: hypothetical protein DSZ31_04690 [Gammaproteobacteria bacterium]RTZ69764.1 MAG: hypothetical protein DSZ30_01960 [Aquificaceae bacterium]
MVYSGALVAFSNEKNILIILKVCENADKLLEGKNVKDFIKFSNEILEHIKEPTDILDYYTHVKMLYRVIKERLQTEKVGFYVYDLEVSYPIKGNTPDELERAIENEALIDKPILAYSRCFEDVPILLIADLDSYKTYEVRR